MDPYGPYTARIGDHYDRISQGGRLAVPRKRGRPPRLDRTERRSWRDFFVADSRKLAKRGPNWVRAAPWKWVCVKVHRGAHHTPYTCVNELNHELTERTDSSDFLHFGACHGTYENEDMQRLRSGVQIWWELLHDGR